MGEELIRSNFNVFIFRWSNLVPEGIIMLFLFLFNGTLVIWENHKRVNELPAKLEKIINQLRGTCACEQDVLLSTLMFD